jgi:hypothetical protein
MAEGGAAQSNGEGWRALLFFNLNANLTLRFSSDIFRNNFKLFFSVKFYLCRSAGDDSGVFL